MAEIEEFDPFGNMSDEELDAFVDEDENGEIAPAAQSGFKSGFVALVGRPNAGKSTYPEPPGPSAEPKRS